MATVAVETFGESMLNILIVDDNAGKIVEIKNAICQIASGYKINFSEASNIANACGLCGWPRKLDNLTWCKMPIKLT